MDRIQDRLSFFSELVSCNFDLFFWECDPHMNILSTNCPHQELFHMGFMQNALIDFINADPNPRRMPLIFTNSLNMSWITVFESDNKEIIRIHLLGPAFTDNSFVENKDAYLGRLSISVESKRHFIHLIDSVPVIAIYHYIQYGLMFHYCINNEKISRSDFEYYEQTAQTYKKSLQNDKIHNNSNYSNYFFEKQLLKFVEDGNMDYISGKSNISYGGVVGTMSVGDSLRQSKNMIITLVVLCTRAAIRGGLPLETAYTLSDNYIQSIELCKTQSEVNQLSHPILSDYISRVHKCRLESRSSFAKMCCDYISLHLEADFTLQDLADYTNYSEEYMGKKFKKEMKISLKEYIRNAKIERSKLLLTTSTDSIAHISERLHFCSSSYFTKIFHEVTGTTPQAYRETGTKPLDLAPIMKS